jgi:hypothetical protein
MHRPEANRRTLSLDVPGSSWTAAEGATSESKI